MATAPWSSLTEEGKLEVHQRTRRSGAERSRFICPLDARPLRTVAERARGHCDYCAQLFEKDD